LVVISLRNHAFSAAQLMKYGHGARFAAQGIAVADLEHRVVIKAL
jgi:hypothetical protein